MGAELARRATPQRLSRRGRERDAAVLTVRVDGASGLELQHLAPQVIERINIYYGYRAVGQLKFVQAPLRHEPQRPSPEHPAAAARDEGAPHEDLSAVPDGSLKLALDRLGRNVRSRTSRRPKGV